jgi:hypothetical protein
MESPSQTLSPIPFPNAPSDPLGHDLAEIDAAIAMVASGLASRVRLVSLGHADAVAATGLAHAQDASVDFRLDRNGEATAVTVGPRA